MKTGLSAVVLAVLAFAASADPPCTIGHGPAADRDHRAVPAPVYCAYSGFCGGADPGETVTFDGGEASVCAVQRAICYRNPNGFSSAWIDHGHGGKLCLRYSDHPDVQVVAPGTALHFPRAEPLHAEAAFPYTPTGAHPVWTPNAAFVVQRDGGQWTLWQVEGRLKPDSGITLTPLFYDGTLDQAIDVLRPPAPEGAALDLEDAAPPATTLKVCRGPLPSLSVRDSAQDGCVSFVVNATDPTAADYLSQGGDNDARHVYGVSGDPACVGTLPERKRGPLDSGRDCIPPGSGDGVQCAYIAQGYALGAVTGQSCSQAGVGACSGPFCR